MISAGNIVEKAFLIYFLIIYGSYYGQALVSYYLISNYQKRRENFDINEFLGDNQLPSISLIAPAYNESAVILDSVRSLLGLHYFNYELVVVNDGSKDDTLQKLIEGFELEPAEVKVYSEIPTKPLKTIYKSKNNSFARLTVIDKVNGRKADAINVGINHSDADYFGVIDLDCILEPDTLMCLMEPVLKSKEKEVVAVGGVIGATNDSVIHHGKMQDPKSPDTFLPRIQVIEYFRSFILSRPTWSKMNGLLLISGALGLFERNVLRAVDGFSHDSIGEDMDLVMKIHQYCLEKKMNYSVEFIPFPLCWTEVPPTLEILGRQRNRWMRGTLECMAKFKKMALNPKYGVIGMLSYPYWFLAEMLAPILEFVGIFITIYFIFTGTLNVHFAIIIFALVYFMSILLSTFAVVVYYLLFNKYNKTIDLMKFVKSILLEPFIYHPRVLYWSLSGYYDYFMQIEKGWGEMTRSGFGQPKKT